MAVTDQITRIKNARDDIQAALTRKGLEMSGLKIHQFAAKIDEIPGATLQPFSYTMTTGNTVTDNVEVNTQSFESWTFVLSSGETISKTIDKDMVTANFENIDDIDSFTIPEGDVNVIYRLPDYYLLWAKEYGISANITEYTEPFLEQAQTIRWSTNSNPEGLSVYPVRLVEYYVSKDAVAPTWTETVVWDNEKHTENSYTGRTYSTERETLKYKILFRLYRHKDSDVNDYLDEFELTTPKYVATGTTIYTIAPYFLPYSINGRTITLNWGVHTNSATAGFRLEYSYSGSSWTSLFWSACASNSYSFTVPDGQTKVAFRIQSYSTRSKYEQSEYTYSDWIEFA